MQSNVVVKYSFVVLVAGTLALASDAAAQQGLEGQPGYVDYSVIERLVGSEAHLEINVKGALLRMVTEASRADDPELSGLLSRLQAIQVRGYRLAEQRGPLVREKLSELARDLERQGWETMVRVRDGDQHVYVYLRSVNDVVAGLAVMTVEADNEAVFVNIVGEIDPAQIGRLGQKFNINALDRIRP